MFVWQLLAAVSTEQQLPPEDTTTTSAWHPAPLTSVGDRKRESGMHTYLEAVGFVVVEEE